MFQPDRLKLARHRRGMNKSTLAKALGVSLQTASAYERGDSGPTGETVNAMARVLDYPVSFFFEAMSDAVAVDAASFRKLSRMTASQRDRALAAGTHCVELNEWIEARFDLPSPDVPDVNAGLVNPEGAAALVRARWNLGDAPIGHMLHLAEAHGVRVFSLTNECREIDAYSFWRNGTPYVCLGTHKTAERAVFDLAHELGHLVLHRDHAAPRGRLEERQADEFASHLLMPPTDVRAMAPRFPSFDDLVRAKRRWRVSVAALNYRMHALGLTSDWHYRTLCMEISGRGRDTEPNSIPREQSQVLEKVFTMLRAEGIGRAQVARELHIQSDDLNDLVFGLTLSVLDGGDSNVPARRPELRVVGER